MSKNYIVVQTQEEYDAMMNHIKASDLLAYDTETTGLNTRKDDVIGFSVSGEVGVGYYFPIVHWNGSELVPSTKMDFKPLLSEIKKKRLIMYNGSYDVRITKSSLDVDLLDSLYADAMLLKHTCDEEHPFALKQVAKKIQKHIGLDVEEAANKEQQEMIESIKANGGSVAKDSYELYKADMMKIGIYACADTDLTLRVFNYYSDILAKEGLVRFFYNDEVMPLYKLVTIPMESKGVPIDVELIEESRNKIIDDINDLEDKIQEEIKPYLDQFETWFLGKEFPPSRTGSFAQALCEYAQLDLPRTKTGRYSITRQALEALEPSLFSNWLLETSGVWLPQEIIRDVQALMMKQSGIRYMFNISSKHHLSKLFFGKLEEEAITFTPKGNPQMNDLFLDSMMDKYSFVPLIRTFNKLNKLKSAYMDRFLDRQEDGIFYPSFMQHRTISGRYGSDMQQLPRPIDEEDKHKVDERVYYYTNLIRQFFISGDNYVFVDADYESLEPHVFAHISGDAGLKNIFLSGNDFYSTIAIDTEGLEAYSADKKADNYLGAKEPGVRQKAKAYALGIPYGMEAYALSKNLDIPQKDAEKLVRAYLDSYPELKAWMERSNEQCKKYGRVYSEAGRIRHMKLAAGIFNSERNTLFTKSGELIDSLELWKAYNDFPKQYSSMKWKRKQMKNYLNNAKNFQIQSLAASITNRACIAIAKELKRQGSKGYVCAQVHDQIVVRVPEAESAKWRKTVQYLMENTYKISLPLKAPAEVAKNMKEGH